MRVIPFHVDLSTKTKAIRQPRVVVNMYLHNLSNKYPVIFDFARLKVSIYLTSVQYYQPRGYVTQKGCQKIRNQNTKASPFHVIMLHLLMVYVLTLR